MASARNIISLFNLKHLNSVVSPIITHATVRLYHQCLQNNKLRIVNINLLNNVNHSSKFSYNIVLHYITDHYK